MSFHFTSGTTARDCTPLMFVEIELEDVQEGMALRLQEGGDTETLIGVVRLEHFSPTDEGLVLDVPYRNANLLTIFREYRVSALVEVN